MVLTSGGAAAIVVTEEHVGFYDLTNDDSDKVEVKELVQAIREDDGTLLNYVYSYTLTNDNVGPFAGEVSPVGDASQAVGLSHFDFLEPLDGGVAWGVASAPGWNGSLAGNTPTWWVTDKDKPAVPTDGHDIEANGLWDANANNPGGVNNFAFGSNGAPFRLYDVQVISWGPDQTLGTADDITVTGQISGPTPEPCTLALLGLGLSGAAFIRRFGRKRE
jgi:hypothetical protein